MRQTMANGRRRYCATPTVPSFHGVPSTVWLCRVVNAASRRGVGNTRFVSAAVLGRAASSASWCPDRGAYGMAVSQGDRESEAG
jgi:hypothetical protein